MGLLTASPSAAVSSNPSSRPAPGSRMRYPALVGQYLGLLETTNGNQKQWISAVRRGQSIIRIDPRMHPLLSAFSGDGRSSANMFYPEAEADLDSLAVHGLLVDLDDPVSFDPEKYRMVPTGTGLGMAAAAPGFKIAGTSIVTVEQMAYWAWSFASVCPSVQHAAELVADVHPEAGAHQVLTDITGSLAALHRAGCVTIDAALTGSGS